MNKLLLAIAAIAAVSFVSCDTKTATDNNQATDSVFTIEKFTEAIPTLRDSAAVADLMAKANGKIWKVVDTKRSTWPDHVEPALREDLVASYDFERCEE